MALKFLMTKARFYIGVDGGGTGTRIRVTDLSGITVCEGRGAESALSLGIEKSWQAILNILETISPNINIGECFLGAGISGINNPNWKAAFLKANPGFLKVIAKSDGFTTLLGAHNDDPGLIIALGTGSIGMSKRQDSTIHTVSGWGYPSGDEASGSWFGIQAVRYTEKVLDKRISSSLLSDLIKEKCGINSKQFLKWLGKATQTDYAALAPLVFLSAKKDLFAKELINKAIVDIEEMIIALDKSQKLPIVMCGKLGEEFLNFLPDHILKRCKTGAGSSVDGALMLLKGMK